MPDSRELSDKALGLAESGHYVDALDLINKGIKIDANKAMTKISRDKNIHEKKDPK